MNREHERSPKRSGPKTRIESCDTCHERLDTSRMKNERTEGERYWCCIPCINKRAAKEVAIKEQCDMCHNTVGWATLRIKYIPKKGTRTVCPSCYRNYRNPLNKDFCYSCWDRHSGGTIQCPKERPRELIGAALTKVEVDIGLPIGAIEHAIIKTYKRIQKRKHR